MKYSIITASLLAATAFARPHGSAVSERAARRAVQGRKTHPLIPATGTTDAPANAANTTSYSTNWSGAVLTAPPAGTTFDSVSAQFTVPSVAPPSSASGAGSWSAAAWVGIDGDTYGKAILQAGIDFTATRASGGGVSQSYHAWYEWYPAVSHDFSGITMKAGDTISVSCTSSSPSQGVCKIENTSNGQTVSKTMSAPSATATLGGKNAEWIVEDFEQGSSLVPLAHFGDVTFSNAQASAGGQTVGLNGAQMIDIRQSGKVETSVQILSGSSLKVSSLD
ncbi:MAG: hypothetical protein LQ340_004088 [Diploschistes diacapsis]|nr:MAG: hypothetical protein LQ340_004088 [Diploschistes diacapsis]